MELEVSLTPLQAQKIERIIQAYPHERAVVRRVIRRHGELHEREFDRIFARFDLPRRANQFQYFAPKGDVPIVGLSLDGFGMWAQWLDLTQLMVAAGELNARENDDDGSVVYSLAGGH